MKKTAFASFNINGIQVAKKMMEHKNEVILNREMSHWVSDTEFNIRATLQAAGVVSATIQICSDDITLMKQIVIEHIWGSVEGSTFGEMSEGKIIQFA